MIYYLGILMKGLSRKMTVKGFLKKLASHACVYFTLCMLAYIIIAAVVNIGDGELLLDAERTVLFFVFSLLFAAANTVLRLERPSGALRVAVHYVLTLFAFYACFILPLSMRASQVLVGAVIFTVLYFAVFGIAMLFRARYRANREASEKYEKQYSKKSK